VWLQHNGYAIQKRAGRDFVKVERKKHGPMKLYLRLTASSGWVAAGDRQSHRSRALEAVVRDFNEAERVVSGPDGEVLDHRIRQHLDALPDPQVQEMADYYRALPPLTLDDIGREDPRPGRKPFVNYTTLASLVVAMRYREAYLAEPARRDALMLAGVA
jgi:hypothetical protein